MSGAGMNLDTRNRYFVTKNVNAAIAKIEKANAAGSRVTATRKVASSVVRRRCCSHSRRDRCQFDVVPRVRDFQQTVAIQHELAGDPQ